MLTLALSRIVMASEMLRSFVGHKKLFSQEFADNVQKHLLSPRLAFCVYAAQKGVEKVVISRDAASSSNWWYPERKSSFEKWQAPLISCTISSTVGMGCFSLFMAWLATLISIMIRMSPSRFGTITKEEPQVVGPSTFSIISFSSSSISFSINFCLRL